MADSTAHDEQCLPGGDDFAAGPHTAPEGFAAGELGDGLAIRDDLPARPHAGLGGEPRDGLAASDGLAARPYAGLGGEPGDGLAAPDDLAAGHLGETDGLAPGELAAARPFGAGDELERQKAFDVAWRFLAHRDRTEAEVRRNFVKKRTDPQFVEEVVAALLEGGYIDDGAFARRFAEDRRNLDNWGADRIERRLIELGVARGLIAEAVATEHDELAAACELLARRFPAPPETPRDRDRALGFLVRKGYDLELAYDALRRHAGASVEY